MGECDCVAIHFDRCCCMPAPMHILQRALLTDVDQNNTQTPYTHAHTESIGATLEVFNEEETADDDEEEAFANDVDYVFEQFEEGEFEKGLC